MGKVRNPLRGDQLPIPGTEAAAPLPAPSSTKPKKPPGRPRRPGRPLSSAWVTTAIATEQLGISAKTLWKYREECLREGTHYRNIARPNAARPTYRWHLERIEQLLGIPQEQRGESR
ncbi:MAG: excisionase family protein [Cyanobacteria bacterium Co-bin13]|nr:excisionase family protein [Cyanobacteria bacterium Co-bin13]